MGGGTLEVGNLYLVEEGNERSGTIGSASEIASEYRRHPDVLIGVLEFGEHGSRVRGVRPEWQLAQRQRRGLPHALMGVLELGRDGRNMRHKRCLAKSGKIPQRRHTN